MEWQLSPECYKILKKLNVRAINGFWETLAIFERDPNDLSLDHKQLKRNLAGFWKIDIVTDESCAAIYELLKDGDQDIAYFVQVGKKDLLYSE
jgi:hypothetical protein